MVERVTEESVGGSEGS